VHKTALFVFAGKSNSIFEYESVWLARVSRCETGRFVLFIYFGKSGTDNKI